MSYVTGLITIPPRLLGQKGFVTVFLIHTNKYDLLVFMLSLSQPRIKGTYLRRQVYWRVPTFVLRILPEVILDR